MPAGTVLVALVPSGSYRYTVMPLASTTTCLPFLSAAAASVPPLAAVPDEDAVDADEADEADAGDDADDDGEDVLEVEVEDEPPQPTRPTSVPRTRAVAILRRITLNLTDERAEGIAELD